MKTNKVWIGMFLGAILLAGIAAIQRFDYGLQLVNPDDQVQLQIRKSGNNQSQPWIELTDGDGTLRFQIPANGILPTQYGGTGNASGSAGNSTNATAIQGVPVSATTPAQNQGLNYNALTGQWEPVIRAEIQSCLAVATANVASLSGTTTIDGVALAAGNRVLLVGQSTGSQNGPWTVAAGAWTRPSTYAAGQAVSPSAWCMVVSGTIYANTSWQLTGTTSAITVDTTATTWDTLPGEVNSQKVVNTTCANLGTGTVFGQIKVASDCLTPWGTGDRVMWNGSGWVLTSQPGVLATNDFTAYMLSCVTNAVVQNSQISLIASLPEMSSVIVSGSLGFPFASRTSGGSVGSITITTNGTVLSLITGSSSSGAAGVSSILVPAMSSGDIVECGARCGATADANGTDNYVIWVGAASTVTTNYPTDGFFFLRDRYNATGHGQSYTNDWIMVTAKSSSYSYADSGLALSTSTSALSKLKMIATTASVYLFNKRSNLRINRYYNSYNLALSGKL